jgi:hypothetical protein
MAAKIPEFVRGIRALPAPELLLLSSASLYPLLTECNRIEQSETEKCAQSVLRIGIRDPVLFRPLDPGSVILDG